MRLHKRARRRDPSPPRKDEHGREASEEQDGPYVHARVLERANLDFVA